MSDNVRRGSDCVARRRAGDTRSLLCTLHAIFGPVDRCKRCRLFSSGCRAQCGRRSSEAAKSSSEMRGRPVPTPSDPDEPSICHSVLRQSIGVVTAFSPGISDELTSAQGGRRAFGMMLHHSQGISRRGIAAWRAAPIRFSGRLRSARDFWAEWELEKSAKSGGRDRDRTCDPYHVKVVLFR
jgi:hypothetical protein